MRCLLVLLSAAPSILGCSSEHAFLGAARAGGPATAEESASDAAPAPPPAADAVPEESKPADKPHDVTGVFLRCDEIPFEDGRADFAYFGCNVLDAQGVPLPAATELFWSVRERDTLAELAHEAGPSPYPEWRAAIGFDALARGRAEIAVQTAGGVGPAGVFAPEAAEPPPVVETVGEMPVVEIPSGCVRLPFAGGNDLHCAADAAAWRVGPTNGLVCCTLALGSKVFGKSGKTPNEARDEACDWREIQTGVTADGRPLCTELAWNDYTLSTWTNARPSGADDWGCRDANQVLTAGGKCARIVVRPIDLDKD